MLERLLIRDFVIVDRLELDFGAGFGALTGETGAGKSILVDALALVLGDRAEAGVVRAGCEKAEISAEFAIAPKHAAQRWLQANDFDDDSCVIRRVIDAGGRSRAYINGSAASLGQLRELSDLLADIHGQHAHHQLLRSEAQRDLLDEHAGARALVADVAHAHATWRSLRTALTEAERNREASARERELLQWQVGEFEALAFDASAWRETEREQRRLANASELLATSSGSLEVLDEGDASLLGSLQHIETRLAAMGAVDPLLGECATLLGSAAVQVEEAVTLLRRYRDRLDLDPARLAELDARINAVLELARKYRIAPDEIPEHLDALRQRLGELDLLADPTALAQRCAEAEGVYVSKARELSAVRAQAAAALAAAVTAAMQELAMAGGRIEIALVALDEGTAHGLEEVEFRVALNAGQGLRPLAKVASGGELSRIGLALQVIASQQTGVDTLVFDEVDVGIGGRVAEVVGRLLRQLGNERQVLCVTHLPQVAARAHWQWSIAKQTRDGVTLSSVRTLDEHARVEEIARMLGGEKITDTTRRHAREMLAG